MTRSNRQRNQANSRRTLRQKQNGMDGASIVDDPTCPPRDPPGCRAEELIMPRQPFMRHPEQSFVVPSEMDDPDDSGHNRQWYERVYKSPADFIAKASGLRMRTYQSAPCMAIIDSVVHRRGLSFVILFPRQSGKNELQAQIETYLLIFLSQTPAEMVKVSPTWKPQTLNAMRRLERVLKRNT
jgi:hypothetical protein